VELDWDELTIEAHADLVALIDALHVRGDTDTVHFCPDNPIPSGAEADDYLWCVVPAISEGDIDLIYENRVRARAASLMLKARNEVATLPGWLD